MSELFGSVKENRVENGTQVTIFNIPAVSKTTAKGRARGNSRIKGLNNFEIVSVERSGSAGFPGGKLYEVRVESER